MDRKPEDLKLLGFFGICGQAYKIIYSWRNIITKITISLILPLSLIFLANRIISETIFAETQRTLEYQTGGDIPIHHKISQILHDQRALEHQIASYTSLKYAKFMAFHIAYFIFVLIISLLSTSAIVYTVACVYINNREITFRKIMSVVPKVWKRLMITFLWNFLIVIGYTILMALVLVSGFFLLLLSLGQKHPIPILIFIVVWMILYLVGLIYINVVWNLACVVSVLEEDMYGIKAIRKSMVLIKGKLWAATVICLISQILLVEIDDTFSMMIDNSTSSSSSSNIWESVGENVMYGILCLLLLLHLNLVGLVIQSVIYFVCKSYHNESIDKTSLGNHLKVYLVEYVPLKVKEIDQFQQNDDDHVNASSFSS